MSLELALPLLIIRPGEVNWYGSGILLKRIKAIPDSRVTVINETCHLIDDPPGAPRLLIG